MSNPRERYPSRRRMLQQSLAGIAGLAGIPALHSGIPEAWARTLRKPNVIIFHTDDQEFGTLGCYGGDVLTPHSDGLADSGVLFTRGYTTTGVCMASRYALITGQYPSRCVHPSFLRAFPRDVITEPSFNTPLADGQPTIASVLKKAGYATGFVGKWNIGGEYIDPAERKRLPVPNEWAGAWKELEGDIDPKDPKVCAILEHNHALVREGIKRFGFDYAESIVTNPESYRSRALNYHNPEWITAGAIEFINRYHDRPFFLYLNHNLHHIPHPQESLLNGDPRVTVAGYLDKAPDVMPSRREIYERVIAEGFKPETAYCTWLDEALGAVLRRLAELNLTDDTLIIFFSDNNVPGKGTIYEGGVRVPCMIRYPRLVPGGRRSSALVQNIDFAPTVFDACGAEKPSDMHIDGESLMPLLMGEKDRIHEELFFEIGWTRAVCTERWKYLALRFSKAALNRLESKKGTFAWIYHCRSLEPHQHNVLLHHPAFYYPDQLYDLKADPEEVVNLSGKAEYSDVLDDMKGRMRRWLRTFDHPFGEFV